MALPRLQLLVNLVVVNLLESISALTAVVICLGVLSLNSSTLACTASASALLAVSTTVVWSGRVIINLLSESCCTPGVSLKILRGTGLLVLH